MSLINYSIDEFAELLVDLDGIFAKFTAPLTNKHYTICPTYSDRGVAMGVQAILEGELGQPSHLCINENGALAWRFKSVTDDPETSMSYDTFDAIRLEEQYPEVGAAIESYLLGEHGEDLAGLWRAVNVRFSFKPQMVDNANDRLAYGRKMRACNLLEAEGEARDGFYEDNPDYGIF